jgi:hypothetical protein
MEGIEAYTTPRDWRRIAQHREALLDLDGEVDVARAQLEHALDYFRVVVTARDDAALRLADSIRAAAA